MDTPDHILIVDDDAEIRSLAEPWLDELDGMLGGKARTLH